MDQEAEGKAHREDMGLTELKISRRWALSLGETAQIPPPLLCTLRDILNVI